MATVTVTQQKLVLNAFAAQLQNNLLSKDICTWKQYDSEMDDRNGLQVIEQVGPRYVVTQTTDGVKDLSGGVQDSVFGSEIFKVNKTFGASMGWGDFVKIRDIGAARESEALRNAATQLAEQIDYYVMGFIAAGAHGNLGTAGNAVDSFADLMQGYTRLKERGVADGNMGAILSYSDQEALAETMLGLYVADGIASDSFRNGFSGKIGNLPVMFTQQLATVTNGNDVTGVQVNGAAENKNYVDVATSTAPGFYKTQLLNVKGLTATTGTVTAGSAFTIADVYEWDNRAQKSTGRLQLFTVVTGATADGSGDASIRIYPAIIVQGSSDVNTAHATVDSIPADSAALTFVGTASQTYTPRLIVQKDSVVINTADLIMPASDTSHRQQLSKVPLSVRMWQKSDFATGAHSIRFDVALTANWRDRTRAIRINGS